jgi:hypothetical protein
MSAAAAQTTMTTTTSAAAVATPVTPTHAPGTTQAQLAQNQAAHLVKSQSGAQLYVESEPFDPVAHHRARGRDSREANKGEGLGGALCPCFPRFGRRASAHAAADVNVDRHYTPDN